MDIKASDFPNRPSTRVFKWITEGGGNRFLVLRGKVFLWSTEEERQRVIDGLERLPGLKGRVINMTLAGDDYQISHETDEGEATTKISKDQLAAQGALDSAVRVQEVTLRTFRLAQQVHAVVAGLRFVASLLASPFSWLYRAIAGTKHGAFVESLPGGGVNHSTTQHLSPTTMLPQLKFASEIFKRSDVMEYGEGAESGAQMVGETLAVAHKIGVDWKRHKAASQKEQTRAIKRAEAEIVRARGEGRPCVIPIGRGEGKDFVQHFVIFDFRADGMLVKEVCMHSPTAINTRFYSTSAFNLPDDEESRLCLLTELFSLNTIEGQVAASERELGSARQEDQEIERLLLSKAQAAGTADQIKRKGEVIAGRDPVRLLYEVVKQMEVTDNPRAIDPQALTQIKESKRSFYSAYVNSLVGFYEEERDSLTALEKIRVLKTIQACALNVRDQVCKEAESKVAASEAITALQDQVRQKLEGLEKSKSEESKVRRALEAEVELFQTLLDRNVAMGGEHRDTEAGLDAASGGVRVTSEQFEKISALKEGLLTESTAGQIEKLRELNDHIEQFLEAGDAASAYSISFRTLRTLPTSRKPEGGEGRAETCWATLDAPQLLEWLEQLSQLSQHCMESAARTKSFPLPPRDMTEFYSKLPLLMLDLYDRRMKLGTFIEDYEAHVDQITNIADGGGFDNEAVQKQAELFQKECYKEIEKEVNEEFKEIKSSLEGRLKDEKEELRDKKKSVFIVPPHLNAPLLAAERWREESQQRLLEQEKDSLLWTVLNKWRKEKGEPQLLEYLKSFGAGEDRIKQLLRPHHWELINVLEQPQPYGPGCDIKSQIEDEFQRLLEEEGAVEKLRKEVLGQLQGEVLEREYRALATEWNLQKAKRAREARAHERQSTEAGLARAECGITRLRELIAEHLGTEELLLERSKLAEELQKKLLSSKMEKFESQKRVNIERSTERKSDLEKALQKKVMRSRKEWVVRLRKGEEVEEIEDDTLQRSIPVQLLSKDEYLEWLQNHLLGKEADHVARFLSAALKDLPNYLKQHGDHSPSLKNTVNSEREAAVERSFRSIGALARQLNFDRTRLAYALAKPSGLAAVCGELSDQLYLRLHDFSQTTGQDVEWHASLCGAMQHLRELQDTPELKPTLVYNVFSGGAGKLKWPTWKHGVNLRSLRSFEIGMRRSGELGWEMVHGDEADSATGEQKVKQHLIQHFRGFLSADRKGYQSYAIPELALMRKQVASSMILSSPQNSLNRLSFSLWDIGLEVSEWELYLGIKSQRVILEYQEEGEQATYILAREVGGKKAAFGICQEVELSADLIESRKSLTEAHKDYIGIPTILAESGVGKGEGGRQLDDERAELNSTVNSEDALLQRIGHLDKPQQRLLAKQTGLRRAKTGDRKEDDLHDFSTLSIHQTINWIMQNPKQIVENKPLLYLAYNRIFQHGLLQEALRDPDSIKFFIQLGVLLRPDHDGSIRRQVADQYDTQGDLGYLFLLLISHRLKKQVMELKKKLPEGATEEATQLNAVTEALPELDENTVTQLFNTANEGKKRAALFVLAYYCETFPTTTSLEPKQWRVIFEAAFYLRRCRDEGGHSGLAMEYLRHYSEMLLPKLRSQFVGNLELQQEVLRKFDHSLTYVEVEGRPYVYAGKRGGQTRLVVDLQTCGGFPFEIQTTQRVLLKEEIRALIEEQGCRLYEQPAFVELLSTRTDPQEPLITVFTYQWKSSRAENTRFRLEVTEEQSAGGGPPKNTLRIYQLVGPKGSEKRYLFDNVKVKSSDFAQWMTLLSNSGNTTLENMINSKGLWIEVDRSGQPNYSEIYLAQEYQNLNPTREPIKLYVKGQKLLEASVGSGENIRYVCSGLINPKISLLPFRDSTDLLYLSRDRKRVSEIRFPQVGEADPLVLIRGKKSADWHVKGKEGWVWDIAGDPALEKSFGEDYRSFVLPLYNKAAGLKSFVIFPYQIGRGGKRRQVGVDGRESLLLRTPSDFLGEQGLSIDSILESLDVSGDNLPKGMSPSDLTATLSAGIQAAGGMSNIHEVIKRTGAGGDRARSVLELLSAIHAPTPFILDDSTKGMSSSHAGFFYLAMKAAATKKYSQATYYLRMVDSVDSAQTASDEDFKQLQQMVIRFFTAMALNRETPKTSSEIAFLLRALASIMKIRDQLSATYKRDLLQLSLSELKTDQGLPDGMTLRSLLPILGQALYGHYQRSLQVREKRSKLKGDGLILTDKEEKVLGVNFLLSALAYSDELVEMLVSSIAGEGQQMRPVVDMIRAFFTTVSKDLPLPAVDTAPTEGELSRMRDCMMNLHRSEEFSSVEAMHAKLGSEPKWETVLSNFWLYYEWILKEGVKREELTFLYKQVPATKQHHEEVNIARRVLLLHYETKGRLGDKLSVANVLLEQAKEKWSKLPLDGERLSLANSLDREFQKNPTLWGLIISKTYGGYCFAREKLQEKLQNLDWEAVRHNLPRKILKLDLKPWCPEMVERQGIEEAPAQTATREYKEFFKAVIIDPLDVKKHNIQWLLANPNLQRQLIDDAGEVIYQPPEVQIPEASELDQKRERAIGNDGLNSLKAQVRSGLAALSNVLGGEIEGNEDLLLTSMDRYLRPLYHSLAGSFLEEQDPDRAHQQIGSVVSSLLRSPVGQPYMQGAGQALRLAENARPLMPLVAFDPVEVIKGALPYSWRPHTTDLCDALKDGDEQKTGLVIAKMLTADLSASRAQYNPALEDRSELKVGEFHCNPVIEKDSPKAKEGDYGCNPEVTREPLKAIELGERFKNLEDRQADLEAKIAKAKRYANKKNDSSSASEQYYLNTVKAGLEEASKVVGERTVKTLQRAELVGLAWDVEKRLKDTHNEKNSHRTSILRFAKQYQEKLRLVHVYGGKGDVDENFVIKRMLAYYEEGSLNRFGKSHLEQDITEHITKYLYASTEMMQLKRSAKLLSRLHQMGCEHDQKARSSKKRRENADEVQKSIEWCALSQQLWEALSNGTDRTRYLNKDHRFDDPALGRLYLLFDYRTGFVTRSKARTVVEHILNREQVEKFAGEGGEGKARAEVQRLEELGEESTLPQKELLETLQQLLGGEEGSFDARMQAYRDQKQRELHVLRMGLGKTTFISPLVATELLHRNKRPIAVTTNLLVRQLHEQLGPRAYFFEFDLHDGLGSADNFKRKRQFHERVCGLNPEMMDEEVQKHLESCQRQENDGDEAKRAEQHLERTLGALNSLQEQGRYVVTTPAELALLRNRRVILLESISKMGACEERTKLYRRLDLVQKIEEYFYHKDIVFVPDEDSNLAIDFDYNVARGDVERLNPIRYDVAEKLIINILDAETQDKKLAAKREALVKFANDFKEDTDLEELLRNSPLQPYMDGDKKDDLFMQESLSERQLAKDLWDAAQADNNHQALFSCRESMRQLYEMGLEAMDTSGNVRHLLREVEKASSDLLGLTEKDHHCLALLKKAASKYCELMKSGRTNLNIREECGRDELGRAIRALPQLEDSRKTLKSKCEQVIRLHKARNNLRDLRQKLINNDLRSITDFKKALAPLAYMMAADATYWESGWGFVNWPTDESEICEIASYLIGDSDHPPSCIGSWDPNLEPKDQEHLCALAALRTYLKTTFQTISSVNPWLARGIRSSDGVTPVPYEDGLERENILYATEVEYILHSLMLYLRGKIDVSEELYDSRCSAWRSDDSPISTRNHWLTYRKLHEQAATKQASAVDGVGFKNSYPVMMGMATGEIGEKIEADPEKSEQLRAACMYERILMLHALLDRIPVYPEQVSCNSQELFRGARVELLSGTGDPYSLGLLDPEGFDANRQMDLITAETILSFKDLDERVTLFSGEAVDHIKRQLRDFDCKAILNQDYTTEPARVKELVAHLRKTPEGSKRQFIYRDSETRKKMIWNPGELKPVAYAADAVKRKESFFIYMPPDRRGVDFAVPQGENFYAVAMVGVGIDADTHDQLVWRMRQFGTGQQVRFAIDAKTANHVRNLLGDELGCEGEEGKITTGDVLRYVQHCTVKSRELNRIKRACAEVVEPYQEAVQRALRRSVAKQYQDPFATPNSLFSSYLGGDALASGDATSQKYELLEEFTPTLFGPHASLMLQVHKINWAAEFGVQTTKERLDFLRDLLQGAAAQINGAKRSFELGGRKEWGEYLGYKQFIEEHVRLEDRAQVLRMIESGAELPWFRPKGGSAEEIGYAVSINEIVARSRILLKGYQDSLALIKERGTTLKELEERFYRNVLPDQIQTFGAEKSNQDQEQEQVQQSQQDLKPEVEQSTEVENRYATMNDRRCYPLSFQHFASGEAPRNTSWRWSESDAPQDSYRPIFPEENAGHDSDFISQRARRLIGVAGSQRAFPLVHQLVVKLPDGKFRSCLITAADWEETIHKQMAESDAQATIYQLTAHHFRSCSRVRMGSTQKPLTLEDELSPQFLQQQIRMKLWLDVIEFTPEEWDYLRLHVREFTSTSDLPYQSRGVKLLRELIGGHRKTKEAQRYERYLFKPAMKEGERRDQLAENFARDLKALSADLSSLKTLGAKQAFFDDFVLKQVRSLEARMLGFRPEEQHKDFMHSLQYRIEDRDDLIKLLEGYQERVGPGEKELYSTVCARLNCVQMLLKPF